ncbi:MAG: hypothetical protein HUU46_13955 [Candidatus Hydrogenedentes bacterium]|nr:hypothetical protein [Candidatus Hydrogenedentota bacterium]
MNSHRIRARAAVALLIAAIAHAEGTIDWVVTAYSDGAHNAFTDLAQFNGMYYLAFRHGATHASLDGEVRVMRSADLKSWEPCGTVDTAGDDRDAKLVAVGDTLYLYFGTWDIVHMPGNAAPDRGAVRSYFATTKDGVTWFKVQGVYEPGFWLWRLRHHDGAFYSVAYTAVRPKPDARESRLVRSTDGLNWELVSVVTTERLAGEADILWRPDGAVWVLTRTGDAAADAEWLVSDASMKTWTGKGTGTPVHSPVFATWKDRVFVAGRDYRKDGSTTKLWEFKDGACQEVVTLPSKGDTAYPGLLVDPATAKAGAPAFFITWYSQHDAMPGQRNRADIYAARVVAED